ncbi:type I-E CRISPR-associated endoribonuclease Cas2e [Peptoniphilus sp. KCTC 25270]|uniref:type I-E CRISPR-associated endoribonuclease Cas2e n=1 Tax=Peptoniphilus sp. KCTC 25270 TaxID=2897414 RepID=UPI001E522F02|nr:type I-E CRISPR-associated endoribonuclease Cas2e [Peptoniphilus sp. KCTC 25270]MCD1147296.1 type I-E CRISPR-associated endoribonuclease Cas2e [Peptoniphilus sp. KCTC 25270]
MPLTVITLKKTPDSLRGDLTKWMQEISIGVYVGNFNTRIREKLWERVKETVGVGEATLSYAHRNEIGYAFQTIHTEAQAIDYDGIPLVKIIKEEEKQTPKSTKGFSDAAKFRKAKKYSNKNKKWDSQDYIILDIETSGLDEIKNSIIEVGCIRKNRGEREEYQSYVKTKEILSEDIVKLTGITNEILEKEGKSLEIVLEELLDFMGQGEIIGYGIPFDIRFINQALQNDGKPRIKNKAKDLIKQVKREQSCLGNYKLETVLKQYGIEKEVPHRALEDAKLIEELWEKLNKNQG